MIEGNKKNVKVYQDDIVLLASDTVEFIEISLDFLNTQLTKEAQEELFWCITELLEKHVQNEGVYRCQM